MAGRECETEACKDERASREFTGPNAVNSAHSVKNLLHLNDLSLDNGRRSPEKSGLQTR